MSSHGIMAPYPSVPLNTQVVHIGVHGCSLVILSAQVLDAVINKNNKFLKDFLIEIWQYISPNFNNKKLRDVQQEREVAIFKQVFFK